MLKSHFKIALIIFFFLWRGPLSMAQISSPSADAVKAISYTTYTGNDSVFVFFSPPGQNTGGSLLTRAPGEGSFTFEWRKYDPVAQDFNQLIATETGVNVSTLDDLEEGGYSVQVSNGSGIDTTFYGWLFINNFRVRVEKTEDDRIRPGKYSCDFLILNGFVEIDTFYYFDPVNKDSILLENGREFLWTSDNPDLIIPNEDRVLNPNTTFLPPVIDTWYILTGTDSFGMEDQDSVFYETINVKSEFSFEAFDHEEANDFVPETAPYEAGAPLKVRFTNESVNGADFEWIFADTSESEFFENLLTSDVNFQPEFSYLIPDDYYPALVAKSEEGCPDTFRIEEPITVEPSELEVPNVFSPDGNPDNQYFRVKFTSIREFRIWIYSRSGSLVYKEDVSDMYAWEGWDGTIRNSDRPAPPGIYFFVIEAEGYDDEEYRGSVYKGTVYLFRARN